MATAYEIHSNARAFKDWLHENGLGDNSKLISGMRCALVHAIFVDESLLTDKQQSIMMKYISGMSMTEIAAEDGLNKSTVYRHFDAALSKLKHILTYALLIAENSLIES